MIASRCSSTYSTSAKPVRLLHLRTARAGAGRSAALRKASAFLHTEALHCLRPPFSTHSALPACLYQYTHPPTHPPTCDLSGGAGQRLGELLVDQLPAGHAMLAQLAVQQI